MILHCVVLQLACLDKNVTSCVMATTALDVLCNMYAHALTALTISVHRQRIMLDPEQLVQKS